jgi:dephospho-CoA kinase
MKTILLALAGTPASGKDTVADYLVSEYGFKHESGSDLIREHMKREKTKAKRRTDISKFTLEHLKVYGYAWPAKEILERLLAKLGKLEGKIVVSSVRHPEQAKYLKERGFKIIYIDANPKIRYEREIARKREESKGLSYKEWKKIDEMEYTGKTIPNSNLKAVKKYADFKIDNSGSMEDMEKKVDRLMKKIGVE